MLDGKTVAVVVPAYNEESQIGMVLDTMPDFVDRVIIINDLSKDRTSQVVEQYIQYDQSLVTVLPEIPLIQPNKYNAADIYIQTLSQDEIKYFTPAKVQNSNPKDNRIILINHLKNGGVGAAIATGYKWCKDNNIDCSAVMAGDGQMDPSELKDICLPVIHAQADYVKGNRLAHPSAKYIMPKIRFWGNSILSLLTKVASGYWHISDTQTGYTAISLEALKSIEIYNIYKSYGMPNDMLVKLNIAYCTVKEIQIKPVYRVGEQSKMNISKVIPRVSFLLIKCFLYRIWKKYFFLDFHPVFLFYTLSFMAFLANLPFGLNILKHFLIIGEVSTSQELLAFLFLSIASVQSLLFAMWMDMQENERLYIPIK